MMPSPSPANEISSTPRERGKCGGVSRANYTSDSASDAPTTTGDLAAAADLAAAGVRATSPTARIASLAQVPGETPTGTAESVVSVEATTPTIKGEPGKTATNSTTARTAAPEAAVTSSVPPVAPKTFEATAASPGRENLAGFAVPAASASTLTCSAWDAEVLQDAVTATCKAQVTEERCPVDPTTGKAFLAAAEGGAHFARITCAATEVTHAQAAGAAPVANASSVAHATASPEGSAAFAPCAAPAAWAAGETHAAPAANTAAEAHGGSAAYIASTTYSLTTASAGEGQLTEYTALPTNALQKTCVAPVEHAASGAHASNATAAAAAAAGATPEALAAAATAEGSPPTVLPDAVEGPRGNAGAEECAAVPRAAATLSLGAASATACFSSSANIRERVAYDSSVAREATVNPAATAPAPPLPSAACTQETGDMIEAAAAFSAAIPEGSPIELTMSEPVCPAPASARADVSVLKAAAGALFPGVAAASSITAEEMLLMRRGRVREEDKPASALACTQSCEISTLPTEETAEDTGPARQQEVDPLGGAAKNTEGTTRFTHITAANAHGFSTASCCNLAAETDTCVQSRAPAACSSATPPRTAAPNVGDSTCIAAAASAVADIYVAGSASTTGVNPADPITPAAAGPAPDAVEASLLDLIPVKPVATDPPSSVSLPSAAAFAVDDIAPAAADFSSTTVPGANSSAARFAENIPAAKDCCHGYDSKHTIDCPGSSSTGSSLLPERTEGQAASVSARALSSSTTAAAAVDSYSVSQIVFHGGPSDSTAVTAPGIAGTTGALEGAASRPAVPTLTAPAAQAEPTPVVSVTAPAATTNKCVVASEVMAACETTAAIHVATLQAAATCAAAAPTGTQIRATADLAAGALPAAAETAGPPTVAGEDPATAPLTGGAGPAVVLSTEPPTTLTEATPAKEERKDAATISRATASEGPSTAATPKLKCTAAKAAAEQATAPAGAERATAPFAANTAATAGLTDVARGHRVSEALGREYLPVDAAAGYFSAGEAAQATVDEVEKLQLIRNACVWRKMGTTGTQCHEREAEGGLHERAAAAAATRQGSTRDVCALPYEAVSTARGGWAIGTTLAAAAVGHQSAPAAAAAAAHAKVLPDNVIVHHSGSFCSKGSTSIRLCHGIRWNSNHGSSGASSSLKSSSSSNSNTGCRSNDSSSASSGNVASGGNSSVMSGGDTGERREGPCRARAAVARTARVLCGVSEGFSCFRREKSHGLLRSRAVGASEEAGKLTQGRPITERVPLLNSVVPVFRQHGKRQDLTEHQQQRQQSQIFYAQQQQRMVALQQLQLLSVKEQPLRQQDVQEQRQHPQQQQFVQKEEEKEEQQQFSSFHTFDDRKEERLWRIAAEAENLHAAEEGRCADTERDTSGLWFLTVAATQRPAPESAGAAAETGSPAYGGESADRIRSRFGSGERRSCRSRETFGTTSGARRQFERRRNTRSSDSCSGNCSRLSNRRNSSGVVAVLDREEQREIGLFPITKYLSDTLLQAKSTLSLLLRRRGSEGAAAASHQRSAAAAAAAGKVRRQAEAATAMQQQQHVRTEEEEEMSLQDESDFELKGNVLLLLLRLFCLEELLAAEYVEAAGTTKKVEFLGKEVEAFKMYARKRREDRKLGSTSLPLSEQGPPAPQVRATAAAAQQAGVAGTEAARPPSAVPGRAAAAGAATTAGSSVAAGNRAAAAGLPPGGDAAAAAWGGAISMCTVGATAPGGPSVIVATTSVVPVNDVSATAAAAAAAEQQGEGGATVGREEQAAGAEGAVNSTARGSGLLITKEEIGSAGVDGRSAGDKTARAAASGGGSGAAVAQAKRGEGDTEEAAARKLPTTDAASEKIAPAALLHREAAGDGAGPAAESSTAAADRGTVTPISGATAQSSQEGFVEQQQVPEEGRGSGDPPQQGKETQPQLQQQHLENLQEQQRHTPERPQDEQQREQRRKTRQQQEPQHEEPQERQNEEQEEQQREAAQEDLEQGAAERIATVEGGSSNSGGRGGTAAAQRRREMRRKYLMLLGAGAMDETSETEKFRLDELQKILLTVLPFSTIDEINRFLLHELLQSPAGATIRAKDVRLPLLLPAFLRNIVAELKVRTFTADKKAQETALELRRCRRLLRRRFLKMLSHRSNLEDILSLPLTLSDFLFITKSNRCSGRSSSSILFAVACFHVMQELQTPAQALTWKAVEALTTFQVMRAAWHVVQHLLHIEASVCPLLLLQEHQHQQEQQKQLATAHSSSSLILGWKTHRFPQTCRCWRCCWCSRAWPELRLRPGGIDVATDAAVAGAETPGKRLAGYLSERVTRGCKLCSRKSSGVRSSRRDSWPSKRSSSTSPEKGRCTINDASRSSNGSGRRGSGSDTAHSNASSNSSAVSRSSPHTSSLIQLPTCPSLLHVTERSSVKKDLYADFPLCCHEHAQQQSRQQVHQQMQQHFELEHNATADDCVASKSGQLSVAMYAEKQLKKFAASAELLDGAAPVSSSTTRSTGATGKRAAADVTSAATAVAAFMPRPTAAVEAVPGEHMVSATSAERSAAGSPAATDSPRAHASTLADSRVVAADAPAAQRTTAAPEVTVAQYRIVPGHMTPERYSIAAAGGSRLDRDATATARGRRGDCCENEERSEECSEVCYCNRINGHRGFHVLCSDETLLTVCTSTDLDVLLCEGESRVAAAWGFAAAGAGDHMGNAADEEAAFVAAAAQHVADVVKELKNKDLLAACLPRHANFF